MKIVSKFSKSLIISLFVIGISIFTISSCDNISNTGTPDNKENPGNEIDNSRYGTPCDKTMGNGNYVIHNFIGEKDNFASANTIGKDMNYYLGKGETYVMDLVDKFSKSLQDRPAAQAYFQEFINAQKANKFQTMRETMSNPYGFDSTINGISNASEPVFENIIRNIDTNRDRHLFIRCYQALSNEAYKFGLGTWRNGSSNEMDYYNDVREEINVAWTAGTINNPFDINHDIDNQNCQQVTNEMDNILTHTANNIGCDVTANDLRQVINISTNANSLTAVENIVAPAMEHTGCAINLGIVSAMRDVAREMYQAEKKQTQSLGL